MGNFINLAVYNPAILSDDEFLEGFVARQLGKSLRKTLPGTCFSSASEAWGKPACSAALPWG
ncbi:MAG: hypothetical protein HZC44_11230 [Geobacter sp.]|nr:hypothetical protein [Geobacter sp.]